MNKTEYPMNLYSDIFNGDNETVNDIDNEKMATLNYIMAVNLTPKQREVIKYRYMKHCALEETGDKFNITREAVRQAVEKSLSILRANKPVLRDGLNAYINMKMDIVKKTYYDIGFRNGTCQSKQHGNIDNVNAKFDNAFNVPIDELCLSNRSRNILRRSGLVLTGDILKFGEDKLRSLKGLGDKSFDEIVDKLRSIGLNLYTYDKLSSI
ncbi:MAG: hypothetical protein IJ593_05870 [Lachnospiraceae bacterium]|nr:hypothetical protein [Lachnospiraceae bacterium]